jgi:hypothetical protein
MAFQSLASKSFAPLSCKYTVSVENPEGKRQIARPRSRWNDNIIMSLEEMRWESVYWTHPAQDGNKLESL